ncbi:MAG: hypothetical protein J6S77_07245, partial [Clostridia bacterium]|nr:hypothetical protein [Clostridia bacterium]
LFGEQGNVSDTASSETPDESSAVISESKTLNQVASSATTLTEELKQVFESGGTVDFSEIEELDSVEVIERELVAFDFDTMIEVMSPLSPEFDKMNCDQTPLLEFIASGCFRTCVKNTVKAEGKEYVVYSLLSFTTEKNSPPDYPVVLVLNQETKDIVWNETYISADNASKLNTSHGETAE